MLEILVQLRESHEVNISSEKNETAFLIVFELLTNKKIILVSIRLGADYDYNRNRLQDFLLP